MRLTYTDYLELPAPPPVAAALLRDLSRWAGVLGAERTGTFWRFGGELYTIGQSADWGGPQEALCWRAEPATGIGPRLEVTVSLADAVISSHVSIRVSLKVPGPVWPGRGALLRRRLRWATRAVATRIAELLREQERDAPPTVTEAPLSGATPAQAALVERLRERYPLTVEQFLAMGALEHLERVARLEQGWERIMRGEHDPEVHQLFEDWRPATDDSRAVEASRERAAAGGQRPVISGRSSVVGRWLPLDYDLIYAGGGLGLLHAAVMAGRYGWRVLLFDRGEVGCAHREWNISREELRALVATGVVSWEELEAVVMREYRDGLVRFFNRAGSDVESVELRLPEVLNVALDAGALLQLMRRKLEAAGGAVLSGRAFRTVRATAAGPLAVEVELERLDTGAIERFSARLLLDGMGSTSPLALRRHSGRPFAGVCPTVGTVAAGFARGEGPGEVDLSLGEILVSVADAQRGEQLMWEGFPGRGDELTVYLFYYSTVEPADKGSPLRGLRPGGPRYSLLDLFEQYFLLLPSYKRPGPGFRHVKPVYGYIPARHSLRRQEAPLLRGVLPVGDSAAQQSPLTFCGFGSHVRNLGRTTALLDYALRHGLLEPAQLARISPFQTNVSLNWVFSRFMQPWEGPSDVNRLQNLFLQVLSEQGEARATRFFRDRMRWSDYHPLLLGVLRRWPQILPVSWRVLGPRGLAQWAGDYLRFSASAFAAAVARRAGPAAEGWLSRLTERYAPALGLRVRAHYEEWRAMGWL